MSQLAIVQAIAIIQSAALSIVLLYVWWLWREGYCAVQHDHPERRR